MAPLKADNSDLPNRAEGNPPDTHPRFGQLLAQAWWDKLTSGEPHQRSRTDVERYVRLGWAGQCARKIGYQVLDVPQSNPPDLAAVWRMELGTQVHTLLQEVFPLAFPGASVEHVIGAEHDETFGFPVSGRTDVYLVEHEAMIARRTDALRDGEMWGDVEGERLAVHPKRTAIEVKTINGFGFKMAIGARGAAQGPRSGALFQAALNGRALDADEVVVVLLSLECLSDRELVSLAKNLGGDAEPVRKFVAEWTYQMADLDDMVDRELKRLAKIMAMVDTVAADYADEIPAGKLPFIEWLENVAPGSKAVLLPPRSIPLEMPAKARVTDPMKGTWQLVIEDSVVDAGSTWQCASYCSFRDQCVKDGPS